MTTTESRPAPLLPDEIRAIDDLRARFDAVGPAREAHLAAISELAEIPREIVMELRDQGLTPDATGEVLGISRQRVSQLIRAAGVPAEPYRAPLTAEERADIIRRHKSGRLGNTRALATEYNVTSVTILKVVKAGA